MPKVVQLRSCGEKPLKKQKSLKWAFFGAFSRIQVVLYLNQLVSQRSKSRNEHTKGSDGLDLQENDKANSANKKTLNHTQSNCMLIRRSECTCSFLFRMAACWSAFPLQTGGHNLAQTNARVLRDLRECQTQPIDMRPTYIRDSASPVKFSGVLGLRLMKKVFSISSNQKNNLCATAKVLELTGLTKLLLGGFDRCSLYFRKIHHCHHFLRHWRAHHFSNRNCNCGNLHGFWKGQVFGTISLWPSCLSLPGKSFIFHNSGSWYYSHGNQRRRRRGTKAKVQYEPGNTMGYLYAEYQRSVSIMQPST